MEKSNFFTCKKCGNNELVVVECGTIVRVFTETQECTCGKGENGFSYKRVYECHEPYARAYLLDEDHRYEEEIDDWWGLSNLEEEPFEETLEEEVYCERCYDNTKTGDIDQGDPEDYEIQDIECYVMCSECGREIEFGWSHPGRRGRIWPSECSDFNPWKCWPEPRYRESWKKKGWLRPMK